VWEEVLAQTEEDLEQQAERDGERLAQVTHDMSEVREEDRTGTLSMLVSVDLCHVSAQACLPAVVTVLLALTTPARMGRSGSRHSHSYKMDVQLRRIHVPVTRSLCVCANEPSESKTGSWLLSSIFAFCSLDFSFGRF
jgi:hypothetical protein